MKLSIIVPVYKAEKYLDKCIESIANQTYRTLEIILVDDGSPDLCPQICDAWAEKDSRVRVIHKQNAGQGFARNDGIAMATGEYICFFDSDDYIDPTTIDCAYQAAVKHGAELVCFGIKSVNLQGQIIRSAVPDVPKEVYRGEEVQEVFLPMMVGPDPKTGKDYGMPKSACCKLFSMQAIQRSGWRFVSEREIISEDYYSVMKLCRDLQSVCILPYAFYTYFQSEGSFSRAYQPGRFEKICYFYTETKKMCNAQGYNSDVTDRLGGVFLSAVIGVMKKETASGRGAVAIWKTMRSYLNDPLMRRILQERKADYVPFKKKILFFAMRHRLTGVCCLLSAAQNRVR